MLGWLGFTYECFVNGQYLIEATQTIAQNQNTEKYDVKIDGFQTTYDGYSDATITWYCIEVHRISDGFSTVVHRYEEVLFSRVMGFNCIRSNILTDDSKILLFCTQNSNSTSRDIISSPLYLLFQKKRTNCVSSNLFQSSSSIHVSGGS